MKFYSAMAQNSIKNSMYNTCSLSKFDSIATFSELEADISILFWKNSELNIESLR